MLSGSKIRMLDVVAKGVLLMCLLMALIIFSTGGLKGSVGAGAVWGRRAGGGGGGGRVWRQEVQMSTYQTIISIGVLHCCKPILVQLCWCPGLVYPHAAGDSLCARLLG